MAAELGFGVVGLGMGTNHCRSVTRARMVRSWWPCAI